MVDRPLDQVFANFKNANQKNKESLKYVFEKSDAISLWIIGLSVGALALLVTNILNIKKSIPVINLPYLVLALSSSIIAGIIYRILFLYWFTVQNQIGDEIDIAFTIEKQMHRKSQLQGNETFEELIFVVQDSTGVDYSHLITLFKDSEELNKKTLYDSLVQYYLKSIEFAKKDLELALDAAIGIYAKAGAITKEKFKTMSQSYDSGLKAKLILRFVRIFYIIFNIAFLMAIYLFATSIR